MEEVCKRTLNASEIRLFRENCFISSQGYVERFGPSGYNTLIGNNKAVPTVFIKYMAVGVGEFLKLDDLLQSNCRSGSIEIILLNRVCFSLDISYLLQASSSLCKGIITCSNIPYALASLPSGISFVPCPSHIFAIHLQKALLS